MPNSRLAPVQPVAEAVKQMERRDTADVVAPRLRGTLALGARAIVARLAPASALGAINGLSVSYGPELAMTSIYTGTGAAMAAGWYVGRRTVERRRLAKREAAQEAVRTHLGEPVDIIRNSRAKGRKQGGTLFWQAEDTVATTERLAKLVDFSKQHKLASLLIPVDLLEGVDLTTRPGKDKRANRTEYGRLTTIDAKLKKAKAIKVHDRKAGPLLESTVTEAARLFIHTP